MPDILRTYNTVLTPNNKMIKNLVKKGYTNPEITHKLSMGNPPYGVYMKADNFRYEFIGYQMKDAAAFIKKLPNK